MVDPTDDPTSSDSERSGARFFQRGPGLQSPSEALHPEAPPAPPTPPPSKRRPTLSALSGFLTFLLVAAFAAAVGVVLGQQKLRDPGPLKEEKVLYIAPRTDVPEILALLEREGVIDTPLLLNAALVLEGNRSKVKAGEYLFKREASLRDVIDTLVSGRQVLHSITIPEGLTSSQIVQRLRDNDILAGEIREIPKEGMLLPETYRVARGMSRTDLLRKMEDEQRKLLDQIWARRSSDLPLRTPYELVTLASIVEKETGRADERSRVASVFLNRLGKRMKLQSDPTIVYGLVGGKGTLGRGITRSEITQPTAYNTYVIEGLPPGPIANPGRAALEAVANPSRTKDLYFVADGSGGHAFSETLEQHSRNVARWRQIEKEAKEKAETDPAAAEIDVDRAPPVSPGEAATPAQKPSKPSRRNRKGAFLTPPPVQPSHPLFGALARPTSDGAGTFFGLAGPSVVAPPLPVASAEPKTHRKGKKSRSANAKPAPGRSIASFAMGPGIEELGISIQGVYAKPELDGPVETASDASSAPDPGVDPTLYPVDPRRLADQRARAASLGLASGGTDLIDPRNDPSRGVPGALALRSTEGATPGSRPRIYDASEGTALDPLLNKSWDLNSPQTVPANIH